MGTPIAALLPQLRPAWQRLPALGRIFVWLAGLLLLVAIAELAAQATGMPLSLLDKGAGGTLLIVVALTSLLALVTAEGRPLSDYGLVATKTWFREALTAFGWGLLLYGACCAVCLAAGVYSLRFDSISPGRVVAAALAGLSALPVAATQQIVFGALLLGWLRMTCGRIAALCLPAALLALASGLGKSEGITGIEGQRLFCGMFLLAAFLGLWRLRTGTIVAPAGFLAGAIALRKVTSKLRLFDFDPSADWSPWLAPASDPRQGFLLWGTLAAGCAGMAMVLWRRGEQIPTADAAVDASFKRIVPFSNLLAFAPLDIWIRQLWLARFRVGIAYLPRLVFTLIASSLNTLVSLPERLLAPRLLKHAVPDPVFIVGMHRSGTTHLHQLLALDEQFRSPRNYEVFNPHGFLTGWTTTAALAPLLMWRRPMDAVQLTPFSSQEEEFALAGMGSPSLYWSFCFPRQIARHNGYWHTSSMTSRERTRWQAHYMTFLRKITWRQRKRPLLKNPVNTSRVAALKEMFPGAKFIYLVRHPYAVFRSNLHFGEHGIAVFQLQNPDPTDNYASRVLDNYRAATDACERDLALLPPGDVARLRFEDLEVAPLEQVQRIYAELGLSPAPGFMARLEAYLASRAGYTKNRFPQLPAHDQQLVEQAMGHYLRAWGYDSPPHRQAA